MEDLLNYSMRVSSEPTVEENEDRRTVISRTHVATGDVNPAHLDPAYAKTDMCHQVIAHGAA